MSKLSFVAFSYMYSFLIKSSPPFLQHPFPPHFIYLIDWLKHYANVIVEWIMQVWSLKNWIHKWLFCYLKLLTDLIIILNLSNKRCLQLRSLIWWKCTSSHLKKKYRLVKETQLTVMSLFTYEESPPRCDEVWSDCMWLLFISASFKG